MGEIFDITEHLGYNPTIDKLNGEILKTTCTVAIGALAIAAEWIFLPDIVLKVVASAFTLAPERLAIKDLIGLIKTKRRIGKNHEVYENILTEHFKSVRR